MVTCKKKAATMHEDEGGYIVVETVGAFVPFVLLVVSILSLVNIVAVQARMHYAMTQAANTLSMYSYTLEVLGMANKLTSLSNKAERVSSGANKLRDDINAVLTGVESLSNLQGAAEHAESAATQIYNVAEQTAGDPKAALQMLMCYGVNELRNAAFAQLVRPLIGRYLANGDMSGDEYLRRAGVVRRGGTVVEGLEALEFFNVQNLGAGNSVLIDSKGNVKLVVKYEIKYTFGGLRLPFEPTLRITQTVVTKAWLNGSGKGYE